MKVAVILDPSKKNSIYAAARQMGLALVPTFGDSAVLSENLKKYHSIDIEVPEYEDDMANTIIQNMLRIDGVEAAYVKPQASVAGWVVQEDYCDAETI